MSDNKPQSHQDGNATPARPRSVWMAHWTPTPTPTPTGSKSANQPGRNSPIGCNSGEDGSRTRKRTLPDRPMRAIVISKRGSGSGEVAGVGVGADDISSGGFIKRRKEVLDSEPFPKLNVSQHREGNLALNIEPATVSHEGDSKFQTGSSLGHKIPYRDGKESRFPLIALVSERGKAKREPIKSKGIQGYPPQHEDSNKNALAVSTFVRDEIMPVGSASKSIPYEVGTSGIPFTTCEPNVNNQSNAYLSSKTRQVGNTNFHSYSTLFVHETKINQILDPKQSANSLGRQNVTTFLLHKPSSSNLDQPNLFTKCDARTSSSNISPFQSHSNHPGPTPATIEHLRHGGYSLLRLPYSVHDVGTMRICTGVDSVGEALRGPPKFSQATRRFVISKKTDVSVYEGQEFKEAVETTNLKGKVTSAHLSLSTNSGKCEKKDQGNESMQPSVSVDGDTQNFGNIKTSAACRSNESSSETDIMDMDTFQENQLTGAESSLAADKDLGSLKSPLPSASTSDSARKEIAMGLPEKRVPDINRRPPDLSASTSFNRESSASKTQSLNVDHLLSNAEEPRFSNSTACLDDSPKQEKGSRWFKRLKPCASESVHDTKSSKNEEASSSGKPDPLSIKLKSSSISSKSSMGRCVGKELAVGETETAPKDSDLYSNFGRKNREVILCNPWIQRWRHNRPVSSEKNLETAPVHKPECSKPTLNKPFASIAAMALMSKTVIGFQPCELSKRGSSLVWNT